MIGGEGSLDRLQYFLPQAGVGLLREYFKHERGDPNQIAMVGYRGMQAVSLSIIGEMAYKIVLYRAKL